jgi:transcriptional regulator with XRE-family HTH domain
MARHRLRQRREQLGLTQRDVARALQVTIRTYARYERGENTPPDGRLPALARKLDWSSAQLLLAINDDGQATVPNTHAVPGWLGHLASLEQAAERLCAFETIGVHGLLQTAEYAFAVERSDAIPKNDEGIARRVETRIARQAVLTRQPEPLALKVILDESVLLRVAGDLDVMADQLDHLIECARRPNIDLRVLPFAAGTFPFGSFTLMTSPGASAPYMAVTEDRGGPHYLDRSNELEVHITLFDYLSTLALEPDESTDLITAAAKETRR